MLDGQNEVRRSNSSEPVPGYTGAVLSQPLLLAQGKTHFEILTLLLIYALW